MSTLHPELMKSFDGPARGGIKGKVAEALDVAISLNVGADLTYRLDVIDGAGGQTALAKTSALITKLSGVPDLTR